MIIAEVSGHFINNMKTHKKTIFLIAILAFLSGLLIIWRLSQPKPTSPGVTPPTATPLPRKYFPSPQPTTSSKEKIIRFLPLITENYTIEYLPKVDTIFILISGRPVEKYQTEIEAWFLSQGVENLEELNLTWASTRQGIAP
jgi:hypothetical protein